MKDAQTESTKTDKLEEKHSASSLLEEIFTKRNNTRILLEEIFTKRDNTRICLPISKGAKINNTFPIKTLTAREYFDTKTKDLPQNVHSSRFEIAEMVIYKILKEIASTPTDKILDSLLIEIYTTYISIRHITRKDIECDL